MASPNPPVGQLPPPADLSTNIATGLMNFGFATLGSAFAQEFQDPSLAAPLAQIGTNISNTLRERWYRKEEEDFMNLYGKKYIADAQSLASQLKADFAAINAGEISDVEGGVRTIDPTSEAAGRMRDDLIRNAGDRLTQLDDQLMENAGKYASNPFISQKIQNLVQSRSQAITAMTGPTASQESEINLAKTNLLRAQATAAKRGPQAKEKQLSPEKESPMGLYINVLKADPQQLHGYLAGTDDGRKRISPYMDSARSELATELVAKDPQLAWNKDQLNMRLDKMKSEQQERAALKYIGAVYPPGVQNALLSMTKYQEMLPAPKEEIKPPAFTGLMTDEERESNYEVGKEEALTGLERLVREQRPENVDELLRIWETDWLEPFVARNFAANKGAREEAARFKNFMRTWIKKNWGASGIATQEYGKGPISGRQRWGSRGGPFSRLIDRKKVKLIAKGAENVLDVLGDITEKELPK